MIQQDEKSAHKKTDKIRMNLSIASQQSLVIEGQRMKLCWQILNLWMRVMQSKFSTYKQKKNQISGLQSYGDG